MRNIFPHKLKFYIMKNQIRHLQSFWRLALLLLLLLGISQNPYSQPSGSEKNVSLTFQKIIYKSKQDENTGNRQYMSTSYQLTAETSELSTEKSNKPALGYKKGKPQQFHETGSPNNEVNFFESQNGKTAVLTEKINFEETLHFSPGTGNSTAGFRSLSVSPNCFRLTQSPNNFVNGGIGACGYGQSRVLKRFNNMENSFYLTGIYTGVWSSNNSPITINIYQVVGTLAPANMILLGTQNHTLPYLFLNIHFIPLTIPLNIVKGSDIVIEIIYSSSTFIGYNTTSATNPTYLFCTPPGVPWSPGFNGNFLNWDWILTLEGGFECTRPIARCKAATVQLDAIGRAWATLTDINDNSTSTTGIKMLRSVSPLFNCSHIGTPQTAVLTVTDINDISSNCQATVTVVDRIKPDVICKPITVYLNQSGIVSILPADVFASGTDNCGTVNLVNVQPNFFNCSNKGANYVRLSANDGNGNSNTCTATVTVVDNSPSELTCKPATLRLNSTGTASLSPFDVYLSHTDNCEGINLTGVSPSAFDCSHVGTTQTVTLSAIDVGGNGASCTAEVTVVDDTGPSLSCRNITLALNDKGTAQIQASDILLSVSDACGVKSMTLDKSMFSCIQTGPNNVRLTATDVNGNSSTCVAQVTVIANPNIHNGATEICDGIDNNCNGLVDEGFDLDGDGFTSCAGDCNDKDAKINPGVVEICDGIDNNCNGKVDENVVPTWYADADQDGYGNPQVKITTCAQPEGYVANNGDCADANAMVNPAIAEVCDGIDNNCDGSVDNGVGPVWYADQDGDGFGNPIRQLQFCTQPDGYVDNKTDCNDSNAAIFPGAEEVCNGLDDDCDALVDEDVLLLWFADTDADGHGNKNNKTLACTAPTGFVEDSTDCNDAVNLINPGATELCNNIDDNCNGLIDDGIKGVTYHNSITFSTQVQLNRWLRCYGKIEGSLFIMNMGITDLSPLSNIVEVTGDIVIKASNLKNLKGLDSLKIIGRDLEIQYNDSLSSLMGLEHLKSVGRNLSVFYNRRLTDCCPIYPLLNNGGIRGTKNIFGNRTGCESLSAVNTNCSPLALRVDESSNVAAVPTRLEQHIALYPNPASGEIYLHYNRTFTQGSAQVFDTQGRLQFQTKLEGQTTSHRLITEKLLPGIYFVKAMFDGETTVLRFVKE